MDYEPFDDLARSVVSGAGTRRALLRLSAGGALAGLLARLGLAEVATAKPKHKKAKGDPRRASQAERNRQRQLQAEGKRRKRRGKNRTNKPQCDDLAVPLCGVCEEPLCIAGDWACKALGDTDCGNGVCVWDGECCPGQKKCPGYTECFAAEDCCPNAVPPLCAECDKVVCEGGSLVCRPKSQCCPTGKKVCPDGQCIPSDQCCGTTGPDCDACQSAVCDEGEWTCRYAPEMCPCPVGGQLCPPVPAREWTPFPGHSISLPEHCCSVLYMYEDHHGFGRWYCLKPDGDGAWWCDGLPPIPGYPA